MTVSTGDFELTLDELRVVARCAADAAPPSRSRAAQLMCALDAALRPDR